MTTRMIPVFFSLIFLASCFTPDHPMAEDKIDDSSASADANNGGSNGPAITDSTIDEDAWNQNQNQNGLPAPFEKIFFGYDQSTISSETQSILTAMAKRMNSETDYEIQIEGHCDNRGSTEYNLALGDRRANAVKNYLVELGVSTNRLSTISYGEEKPAAFGQSDQDRALNRRAEFVVSSVAH